MLTAGFQLWYNEGEARTRNQKLKNCTSTVLRGFMFGGCWEAFDFKVNVEHTDTLIAVVVELRVSLLAGSNSHSSSA